MLTLNKPSEFQEVLAFRPVAKSHHFSLHYRRANCSPLPSLAVENPELSTGATVVTHQAVDDRSINALADTAVYLGLVIPKRHARRAVTRSLIRRQAKTLVSLRRQQLAQGAWVLRLRQPFDRNLFPSAASEALKLAVRTELHGLLDQIADQKPPEVKNQHRSGKRSALV